MNKSKRYLLPFLDGEINFVDDSDYIEYLINTYLYIEGDVAPSPSIYLEYGEESFSFIDQKELEKDFKKSKLFINSMSLSYTNTKRYYYKFKFPRMFYQDYFHFIKGEYSKYSDFAKYKIMLFLRQHYPNNNFLIEKTWKVLNKDVTLRLELEERLGVVLSPEFEFETKPDKEEETIKILIL